MRWGAAARYCSAPCPSARRYSLRARSDREVIREMEPGVRYVDGESGEELRRGRGRSAARAVAERAALRGGEPASVRMLAGAAGPEGPERLPALRPPAPRLRSADAAGVTRRATDPPARRARGSAAGCGGDDEPDNPHRRSPTSRCRGRDRAAGRHRHHARQATTPPAGYPPAGDAETQTVPDSPENDTPPPSGRPAQRFEEFCNENPGTRVCG